MHLSFIARNASYQVQTASCPQMNPCLKEVVEILSVESALYSCLSTDISTTVYEHEAKLVSKQISMVYRFGAIIMTCITTVSPEALAPVPVLGWTPF